MVNRLKLIDYVFLLPLAHLIATISFLFSYGIFFGSGLRWFLTASDVANAAVSAMPFTYIVGIGTPIIVLAMGDREKSRAIAAGKDNAILRRNAIIAVGLLLAVCGAVLVVGIVHARDHAFRPLYALPLWFSVNLFGTYYVVSKFGMGETFRLGFVFACGLAALAMFDGANQAQSDRYSKFADPLHPRAVCGGAEVLRMISDRFLVVKPDGTKALFSDDCEESMSIPEPNWIRHHPKKPSPSEAAQRPKR